MRDHRPVDHGDLDPFAGLRREGTGPARSLEPPAIAHHAARQIERQGSIDRTLRERFQALQALLQARSSTGPAIIAKNRN